MINIKSIFSKKIIVVIITSILALFFVCFLLNKWQDTSSSQAVSSKVNHSRAKLVDRNNNILAHNVPAFDLWLDPSQTDSSDSSDEAIKNLTNILPSLSITTLEKNLIQDNKFVYLKRGLTPSKALKLKSLKTPKLQLIATKNRAYPYGNLFSHVIGMVDIDMLGISGTELFFNKKLTNGEPVILSLNTAIQSTVYEALKLAIARSSAKGGVGIVLNINTSEVISMVSLPDFSPVITKNRRETFPLASRALYEFGALLGPITIANALDNKVITGNDRLDVSQPLTVGKRQINDTKPQSHDLTIAEILTYKSKIALGKLALKLGKKQQCDFFESLGFTQELNFELLSSILERDCTLARENYTNIADYTSVTKSYGYGISLTPLHVVNAFSALINGGKLREPTLLKKQPNTVDKYSTVISPTTSKKIKYALGFSPKIKTDIYNKNSSFSSGVFSAKAIKARTGGYDSKLVIHSSISTFLINNQEFIVFAMLDEPQINKNIAGTLTSATVKNIIDTILNKSLIEAFPLKLQK
ncbi:MAG: penicillin-binding transpeptidase domain-containing protein [Colwellia sp.]